MTDSQYQPVIKMMQFCPRTKFVNGLSAIFAVITLTACQFSPLQTPTPASSTPAPIVAADLIVETIEPLPADQALPPMLLQLPALDIEFRVSPMGWTVIDENGTRTTEWVVPTDAAGWHVNSVGAGGAGNTILSGQQAVGDAVFAPLALGEIQPGQQIFLTAEDGLIYAYRVTKVSQPIPMIGATAADKQAAAAYAETSEQAKLTLMTGWPDFSTTHRVFAVAEFEGQAKAP